MYQAKDGCCAARRLEAETRVWTGSRNRAIFFFRRGAPDSPQSAHLLGVSPAPKTRVATSSETTIRPPVSCVAPSLPIDTKPMRSSLNRAIAFASMERHARSQTNPRRPGSALPGDFAGSETPQRPLRGRNHDEPQRGPRKAVRPCGRPGGPRLPFSPFPLPGTPPLRRGRASEVRGWRARIRHGARSGRRI